MKRRFEVVSYCSKKHNSFLSANSVRIPRILLVHSVYTIYTVYTALTFHQCREQGDVGRLPPAGRQRHPDLVQLVAQIATAVLRLGPLNITQRERIRDFRQSIVGKRDKFFDTRFS